MWPFQFGGAAPRRRARGVAPRCLRLEDRVVPVVVPVGPEFRVSSATAGVAEPAVALDADGDFVVAWQDDAADGANRGVLARLYQKNGIPIGGEIHVNSTTAGSQQNPTVARDAAGAFVVAWESASGQDGSRSGVYAQRYTAAGSPVGNEFQVNEFTLGAQSHPAVAMDPSGDFVVVWEGAYQDGDGYGIYYRRYDAAGVPGPETRLNVVVAGDQRYPAVAIDAVGNFVVTWQSDDTFGDGVYARQVRDDGTPTPAEWRVNQELADNQSRPKVASDQAGNFTVAWQSRVQDAGTSGVYARLYRANASAITDEFRVNTGTAGEQTRPVVAVDTAGEVVVSWQSDGQDGAGAGVYAQRLTKLGVPFNPEFRVHSTTVGDQTRPAIGMDFYGDFVVAWPSTDSPLGGIIAQRHFKPPVPQAVVMVDDGTDQRSSVKSLTVFFNTLIRITLGGIRLNGPQGETELTTDDSASTTPRTVLKITFSGANVTPAGLVDGRYVLAFISSRVLNYNNEAFDGNGDGLPGPNYDYHFHRYFGDMDGDEDVDAVDFAPLRVAFGSFIGQPAYTEHLDSEGDGDVDALDFYRFRLHYGLSVQP